VPRPWEYSTAPRVAIAAVRVETVEDDEHDVFLAGVRGGHLQPIHVGLVEVLRLGIERLLGQAAIEGREAACVAVDARGAAHGVEHDAEGVDGNQAV
jgi:hypothetical protein